MGKIKYKFRKAHFEAYFWIIAILFLAFTNPEGESHFTLCLFKNLGLPFCPGCGLGHSIAYLFKGEWIASWQAHPLGSMAIVILIIRAYTILKPDIRFILNRENYEQNFDSTTRS